MKWCERCGGPYRGDVLYAFDGCRLCWLEREPHWRPRSLGWTSSRANWRERRTEANSPCPHASGWWLPPDNRIAWISHMLDGAEGLRHWLATYRSER